MDNRNNQSASPFANEAALYALGLLTPEELAAFEASVDAGYVNTPEVRDMVELVAKLSEARAERMPGPRKGLRAAILARAGATSTVSSVIRADDDRWQVMAPGIAMKPLAFDPRNKLHTVLARLEPGASYPKHRHVGDEQCLVLEGELFTDGVLLKAGDFIATNDGTIHTDTHSDSGCLLLLATALEDEVIV